MSKVKHFKFRNGTKVEIQRIGQFMLARLMVDNASKLPIPQSLVKLGKSQEEKLIPRYDDPVFKELYDRQVSSDQQETMTNIAIFAIKNPVPEKDIAFYKDIAVATKGEDGATDAYIKSLWLMDLIEDEEEFLEFQEAILGTGVATDKALAEAKNKFSNSD